MYLLLGVSVYRKDNCQQDKVRMYFPGIHYVLLFFLFFLNDKCNQRTVWLISTALCPFLILIWQFTRSTTDAGHLCPQSTAVVELQEWSLHHTPCQGSVVDGLWFIFDKAMSEVASCGLRLYQPSGVEDRTDFSTCRWAWAQHVWKVWLKSLTSKEVPMQ